MRGHTIESRKPLKLVIMGDTHLCPSGGYEDMDVLRAAGELIYDEKPDHVIHLGDLGDFRTLNGYKGGAIMGGDGSDEGHDLLSDVSIWTDGLRTLRRRFDLEAERHTRAGHKERIPEIQWHIPFGNHEDMVSRFGRRYPGLKSLISLERLDLYSIARDTGWTPYSFLTPLCINGLVNQHFFQGLNPKQALAIQTVQSRNGTSSTFGHTHEFQTRHWKDAMGRRRTVINTGCSKHPSRLGRYEDSGVLVIDNLLDGEFTYEWKPSAKLLADYYRKNGRLAA